MIQNLVTAYFIGAKILKQELNMGRLERNNKGSCKADLRAEAAATEALSVVVGKGQAAVCCEATQKIVKAVTLVML